MSSSSASETLKPESKTIETPKSTASNPPVETPEDQTSEVSDQLKVDEEGGGGGGGGEGEGEEEDEAECGFCLFMKGGGCKDSFVAWEECIEEAEKNKEDIVEKCFQVTSALKQCMEAHSSYYEPILRAEKMAEEEAVKELEREATEKDESMGKETAVQKEQGKGLDQDSVSKEKQ